MFASRCLEHVKTWNKEMPNGQNTRSDFTYMILHICKIIVCILKNHTTFAPYDFTYMTFEK